MKSILMITLLTSNLQAYDLPPLRKDLLEEKWNQSQTLAPPAINFTEVTVEVEGKPYDIQHEVTKDGESLNIEPHRETNGMVFLGIILMGMAVVLFFILPLMLAAFFGNRNLFLYPVMAYVTIFLIYDLYKRFR